MSGMTEHPETLLSAYLDDALAPAERTSVAAHLDGCARCRGRLAELRATSRLLATLPELAPTRSLRPRVQQGWLWLRPVRLLGSIGSGAFLFLFLASYVINSGSSLGGGTTGVRDAGREGQIWRGRQRARRGERTEARPRRRADPRRGRGTSCRNAGNDGLESGQHAQSRSESEP